MNLKVLAIAVLVLAGCSHSQPTATPRTVANTEAKLSDYSPYKYEVLFTEPVCKEYRYKSEVKSRSGKILIGKPKNVYCEPKNDSEASGSRDSSPQKRLVDWINDPSTKEVWFTYLSFTNKAVKEALCKNAKTRSLKVDFNLDSGTDLKAADELVACAPSLIKYQTRGNVKGLGLAHNKIFLFNPRSSDEVRIVFSSGNMTSGPVLHHENWHFITTNVKSHFAQSHLCVMNAEGDDAAMASRTDYLTYIKNCREKISSPEETDIRSFFVPGEGEHGFGNRSGRRTAFEFLLNGDGKNPGINQAKEIWLACHRFLHKELVSTLGTRIQSGKVELRITADDDTFYDANDPAFKKSGGTVNQEWLNIKGLIAKGAKAKFMETNSSVHQLHHSKFIILDDKAVVAGAANFTQAAFRTNMENIYYITIPEVVLKFREYYSRQWNTMATSIDDLPAQGNVSDKF